MHQFIEQSINDLSGSDLALAEAAREASKRAFAPFSNFNVGAALLTKSGKIVCGTNYESATYTLTTHAEQCAITTARASGESGIQAIATFGKPAVAKTNSIVTPCGLCRQLIFEAGQLSGVDIEVIMLSSNFDRFIKSTIAKLLPIGFGASDFGVDLSRHR